MARAIHEIAADIRATWPKVYFAAVPYLEAMQKIVHIDDMYMADTAKDIVLRFLSNAQYWRGPDAKRIKAELRALK